MLSKWDFETVVNGMSPNSPSEGTWVCLKIAKYTGTPPKVQFYSEHDEQPWDLRVSYFHYFQTNPLGSLGLDKTS